MYARVLQKGLASQIAWGRTVGASAGYWAFPGLMIAGWILWPALDQEWLQGLGLATDPEAIVKTVQEAKTVRMEAHFKAKGGGAVLAVDDNAGKENDDEEEEEEENDDEEAPPEQEEEADPAPADEEEDVPEEDVPEEEDEEEEEEESEDAPVKPLYDPVKGEHLTTDELWDNFILKAVRMNDDDDDDDDDGT
jgi:hypothetical protein